MLFCGIDRVFRPVGGQLIQAQSTRRSESISVRRMFPSGRGGHIDCRPPNCRMPAGLNIKIPEPFALDLWRHEIAHWLPAAARTKWRKQSFFGGLYQKVVITR
jgi:hypothetical protein